MIKQKWFAVLCACHFLLLASGARGADLVDITVVIDPEAPAFSVTAMLAVNESGTVSVRLPTGMALSRAEVDNRQADVASDNGLHVIAIPQGAQTPKLTISYRVSRWSDTGREDDAWAPAAFDPDGSFVPARAWFPLFDPAPKRYRLELITADGQVAVATAALRNEEQTADGYRAVFEGASAAGPPVLFAGPYEVAEREHGAIRMRTYFHAGTADLDQAYLDQAALYLDDYANLIGPYPHEFFYMVSATLPVGLGFPGATYFSRRILPMPFMRTRSLAHEVAHNWWGNGVRPDYANGNWSEGLTTFMADYRLAEAESPVAARDMRFGWLRDYAALPAERDQPVTAFTVREHTAAQVIGYNKVAAIFHMLRAEIGDAAFESGIKAVWQEYAGKTASWDDFGAIFGSAANRDLSHFFDQWTKRRGAPAFALTEAASEQVGEGWRVDITVVQASPVYDVLLLVVVETDDGLHQRSVRLDGRSVQASFQVSARPRAVTIDPDYHLFRRLAPGETPAIMRDVTLDERSVFVVAGGADAVAGSAEGLAVRMLEASATGPSRAASIEDAGDRPVLLIGLTKDIAQSMANVGLTEVPESLNTHGTARAWATRRADGAPIFIVAADNLEALDALHRPLPHYGSRSYVVFDGARAIDKGLWPITAGHRLRRVIE